MIYFRNALKMNKRVNPIYPGRKRVDHPTGELTALGGGKPSIMRQQSSQVILNLSVSNRLSTTSGSGLTGSESHEVFRM